jgi:hypothetical protein
MIHAFKPAALVTAVVVAVMAMVPALVNHEASAGGCESPASYSWNGRALPYGIRTYSVEFCGDDSFDAYAGASWNGNKNISLALVGPDGSIHYFYGNRHIDGEVEGPLPTGTWTLVVRNGTSSNVSFTAGVSFD